MEQVALKAFRGGYSQENQVFGGSINGGSATQSKVTTSHFFVVFASCEEEARIKVVDGGGHLAALLSTNQITFSQFNIAEGVIIHG